MWNEKPKLKQIDSSYAEKIRLKRGSLVHCMKGRVWLTAAGNDFIINRGEHLTWKGGTAAAVIGTLLCCDAEFILERRNAISQLSSRFSHKDQFWKSPL